MTDEPICARFSALLADDGGSGLDAFSLAWDQALLPLTVADLRSGCVDVEKVLRIARGGDRQFAHGIQM
jgi:hypothetical protein